MIDSDSIVLDNDEPPRKRKKTFHDEQRAGPSKMPPTQPQQFNATQSSDSEQSTQQSLEIGDIVIETRNEENPCNTRHTISVRQGNERAQRYRDYHRSKISQRQREVRNTNREEVNRRQREYRLRRKTDLQSTESQLNLDRIESQPTSDNELSIKHAENEIALRTKRQRRYRETHRDEINQRQRVSRKHKRDSQFAETTSNLHNETQNNDEPSANSSCLENLEESQNIPFYTILFRN